jgi:hypothetical protein
MPYEIIKLSKGHYEVKNKITGFYFSHDTTLANAKKQIKLLEFLDETHTQNKAPQKIIFFIIILSQAQYVFK